MLKSFIKISFILIGIIFLFTRSWADEGKIEGEGSKCLSGIEFLSGFGKAKLQGKGDYTMSPFIMDLNFDLKPLTRKINFNPSGLLQFQLEPFISPTYEPNANIEIGTGFIVKVGILPEDAKFQPYVKAGPGILYMTQHTNEQGTQFNFFQYVGVGAHYFFTKNTGLTLEYRYRHVSNSGIERPNRGIETQFALAGIAYRF